MLADAVPTSKQFSASKLETRSGFFFTELSHKKLRSRHPCLNCLQALDAGASDLVFDDCLPVHVSAIAKRCTPLKFSQKCGINMLQIKAIKLNMRFCPSYTRI